MNYEIETIRLPLINNYIRIVQSLARRGRQLYRQFLVHPLSHWSADATDEPLGDIIASIELNKGKKASRLPPLFKQALVKSVTSRQPDLSIPGTLSVDFLLSMRKENDVCRSREALEFVNLLKSPFKEFSELEFQRINRKFKQEIAAADREEMGSLIEKKEMNDPELDQFKEKSRLAVAGILNNLKHYAPHELKNALTSFLITYAVPHLPDLYHDIDSVFAKIQNGQRLMKDVMDAAAILIYHEILKSIQERKMGRAVKFIGKYAVLFHGSADTPYSVEVDAFEKKFYELIERKNLWDKI